MSIFNIMFRNASLGCTISAGPEKSNSKSQRVREHYVHGTQEWPPEEGHSLARYKRKLRGSRRWDRWEESIMHTMLNHLLTAPEGSLFSNALRNVL